MHSVSIEARDSREGSFRVRVRGELDRSAVYELRDRILGLKARGLLLDFSELERADDLALSVLAMWLADRNQRDVDIEFTGLGEKSKNLMVSFGCNRAVERSPQSA
jgi:anti-anti-sigma regulatory factor